MMEVKKEETNKYKCMTFIETKRFPAFPLHAEENDFCNVCVVGGGGYTTWYTAQFGTGSFPLRNIAQCAVSDLCALLAQVEIMMKHVSYAHSPV